MSAGEEKKKRNWSKVDRGKYPLDVCATCGNVQSVFWLFCKRCGRKLRDRTREPKGIRDNEKTRTRLSEETARGKSRYLLSSREGQEKLRANPIIGV